MNEMPMNEQMALNIERKKLDKKLRRMEQDAEDRLKYIGKDKSKYNSFQEQIKKRAQDMEKNFFPR